MKILITNTQLFSRTGTEVVVRDLALGLKRRGHQPLVYSPLLGEIAEEIRAHGILVVSDLGLIQQPPDVIHGHHSTSAAAAFMRFPNVPALFYAHDATLWADAAPGLPNILRYVAVDETVRVRFALQASIPPDRVRVILNSVDLARFQPRGPLPPQPRLALAYGKAAFGGPEIRTACKLCGLELTEVGPKVNAETREPERVLPKFDIVFASARAALEAMAVGAAVVVCDRRGLAGMVTPERFTAWRPLNFGLRALSRPLTAALLREEIGLYDPAAAQEVRERARSEASIETQLDSLEAVYKEMIEEHRRLPQQDREAVALATVRYFQRWMPTVPVSLDKHERLWVQYKAQQEEIERLRIAAPAGSSPIDAAQQAEPAPIEEELRRSKADHLHARAQWEKAEAEKHALHAHIAELERFAEHADEKEQMARADGSRAAAEADSLRTQIGGLKTQLTLSDSERVRLRAQLSTAGLALEKVLRRRSSRWAAPFRRIAGALGRALRRGAA